MMSWRWLRMPEQFDCGFNSRDSVETPVTSVRSNALVNPEQQRPRSIRYRAEDAISRGLILPQARTRLRGSKRQEARREANSASEFSRNSLKKRGQARG